MAGAVDVRVANGANLATLAGAFTYISTSPPTVQVLSPNGGETLFARSLVNIRWSSSDNRAVVRHRLALVRELAPGVGSITEHSDRFARLGSVFRVDCSKSDFIGGSTHPGDCNRR